MAIGSVSHAAGDVCHGRKWRVHEDDGGNGARREVIVDLGRVDARDGDGRKERVEQIGAGLGQLVEEKPAARYFGQDGEQAGAGGWLQHDVTGSNGRGRHGGETERRRRRELLERLRFLRAPRMCRQEPGDLRNGGKP